MKINITVDIFMLTFSFMLLTCVIMIIYSLCNCCFIFMKKIYRKIVKYKKLKIIQNGINLEKETIQKILEHNIDLYTENRLSDINSNETCVICFNEYKKGDKNPQIELLCNHKFHIKCLTSWFDKRVSCPLCNIDLV